MDMFQILRNQNQSPMTAIETLQESFETVLEGIGEVTVSHFEDSYSRNRFVVSKDGTPIAAILFDSPEGLAGGLKTCEVGSKETLPEFRRKGLQNELWKYASFRLALKGLTPVHSENLTELGRLSLSKHVK